MTEPNVMQSLIHVKRLCMIIKARAYVIDFTGVSNCYSKMTGYLDPVTDQDVLLDTT
jgi:hypothetical protein